MKLFELEATLSLDTTGFDKGVSGATEDGKSLAQQLGADAESIKAAFSNAFSFSVGQLMADGFKKALGATWELAEESIEAASAVEQTEEKLKQLFGEEGAAMIDKWASTTKTSFGISRQAAKEYVGDIAALFGSDAIGLTNEQLMEMAMRLTELTGDLASFNNFSVPETWQKLLSGLSGETEAIENLGIDLRASSIAPYFDIPTAEWGKLDQRTRVLKTYEYILASTSKAQGDFARTSDTYQNQLTTFMANVEELKGVIGEGLLPAANGLLSFMNSLFGGTKSTEDAVGEMSAAFVSTYGEISVTTSNALKLVEALERMEKEGVTTDEDFSAWAETLNKLQTLIPSVSGLVDEQASSIAGGTKALREHIAAWKEDGAAMARLDVMKQYYQQVALQEVEVGKAKLAYQSKLAEWQSYDQLESEIMSQAEKYLLEHYPGQYKTYADLYRNEYGGQDEVTGLRWQLYSKGYYGDDETAKALHDAMANAASMRDEAWYGNEEQAYQDAQQRLTELKTEVETLEVVMGDILTEEEQQRSRELEQVQQQRDRMNEAAKAIVEETNKAIDYAGDYDPARLSDAWRTLNELSQDSAKALAEYLNQSEALDLKDDGSGLSSRSWAYGERQLALPEDFFFLKDGEIAVREWQKELEAFKAERQGQYMPDDFFGTYDYSKRTLQTNEDTGEAYEQVQDTLTPAIEKLTEATNGLSGMQVVLDTGVLVGVVSAAQARQARQLRYT